MGRKDRKAQTKTHSVPVSQGGWLGEGQWNGTNPPTAIQCLGMTSLNTAFVCGFFQQLKGGTHFFVWRNQAPKRLDRGKAGSSRQPLQKQSLSQTSALCPGQAGLLP